tara:strand:+ start:39 stop:689 length:651 start_codon:yes stop_codon:yes gene_type:complete
MNFSQKWFTGLSLVIPPILINVLWGVVEGSSAESGDFSAKAEIYAKAATTNTILLCLILISFLCLGLSYLFIASDTSDGSNNPLFGKISSKIWLIFIALFAGVISLLMSTIGLYESGKIQEATTVFMVSEMLGSGAFLLIGLALIFLGIALRSAKNKLQPNVLLHIVSFGMIIFGIVMLIDTFAIRGGDSLLGFIGWMGWHLVSIIFGIGILIRKN